MSLGALLALVILFVLAAIAWFLPIPDPDDDGLSTFREYIAGTDPTRFSSGNNGIADGWMVKHGLDPYSSGEIDTDGDGRSNLTEFLEGTDPNVPDESPPYPFPSDAPRNLVAKENPDGSYDLTWDYDVEPVDRKRFTIRREADDGTWEEIAVVGPNTRTYHVPKRETSAPQR